jgi:hypothetical protein
MPIYEGNMLPFLLGVLPKFSKLDLAYFNQAPTPACTCMCTFIMYLGQFTGGRVWSDQVTSQSGLRGLSRQGVASQHIMSLYSLLKSFDSASHEICIRKAVRSQ